MREHISGWLIVCVAILIQFLMEVTLGRILIAPAVLVPVLVYFSLFDSDYWSIEGAFWSGFVLDLLLHQPFGVSSISMLAGIALARRVLRATTGAIEMTFVINAVMASILTDLLFVFLAARPLGSRFSISIFLIIPRVLLPILLYAGLSMALERSRRKLR